VDSKAQNALKVAQQTNSLHTRTRLRQADSEIDPCRAHFAFKISRLGQLVPPINNTLWEKYSPGRVRAI